MSGFQEITAKRSSKTALGDDGHWEGQHSLLGFPSVGSLWKPQAGSSLALTGLQEGGKLWQIKVHGGIFIEWLLHGEDFRALPFLRV